MHRMENMSAEERIAARAYDHARYLARVASGEIKRHTTRQPKALRLGNTLTPDEIREEKAVAKAAHEAAKAAWRATKKERYRAHAKIYKAQPRVKRLNRQYVAKWYLAHRELSNAMSRRSALRKYLRQGKTVTRFGDNVIEMLAKVESLIAELRAK